MAIGTSVSISGSGFSSVSSENDVMIGGVKCTVTSSNSGSIVCDIGVGPVGSHKVEVNVAGKGNAEHTSGDATFSYDAAISSIDPTSGSQGGKLYDLHLTNKMALMVGGDLGMEMTNIR